MVKNSKSEKKLTPKTNLLKNKASQVKKINTDKSDSVKSDSKPKDKDAKKRNVQTRCNCKVIIKKIKNIIKDNYLILIIFLILLIVNILTIINLMTSIRLQRQASSILKRLNEININLKDNELGVPKHVNQALAHKGDKLIYSNIATDSFFNTQFIDWDNTNLYYNYRTSSLSFEPLFSFTYQGSCPTDFCDLSMLDSCPAWLASKCLSTDNQNIFYQGRRISIPIELRDKEIKKINVSFLGSRWLVAFLFDSGLEEEVYLYFWENNIFSLITDPSDDSYPLPIKTQYGHGNGHLSATGNDNQFLFVYSGYEIVAWLYNDGNWYNVTDKFPLRVSDGGFPIQIIKSGEGSMAHWYLCGNKNKTPKLIKLWQNNTDNIHGSLDLSYILEENLPSTEIRCSLADNNTLMIANKDGMYYFIDNGFDNTHDYTYQSINFSTYTDKKLVNTQITDQILFTDDNLSSLQISSDGETWLPLQSENNFFQDSGNLYVRAKFKTRDNYYSPWFNKLGIIYYYATDSK